MVPAPIHYGIAEAAPSQVALSLAKTGISNFVPGGDFISMALPDVLQSPNEMSMDNDGNLRRIERASEN